MSELIESIRTRFLLYRLRRSLKRLGPKIRQALLVEETRARQELVQTARDAGVV